MKITYERETCTRCGGGGEYSYCQRYGTTCFKCGGKGTTLSRRARSAYNRVQEFKADRYSIPAADVKVGDVAEFSTMTGKVWRTVTETSRNERGYVINRKMVASVTLESARGGQVHMATTRVQLRFTPEQFKDEMVPFARRFKGVMIEGASE